MAGGDASSTEDAFNQGLAPLTSVLLPAQNRPPFPAVTGGTGVEIREYLVLKHDGKTDRFPVRDGDVDQARLRAALSQRPEDEVVIVTDDAYFRISQTHRAFGRLRLSEPETAKHGVT
jgi:hypothetical protein